MISIPIRLQDALDELGRIGKDPNHTDEELREAMRHVHTERERTIASNHEYADMLRRNAKARKKDVRETTPSRGTDLPNSAILRHGHFRMPQHRGRKPRRSS